MKEITAPVAAPYTWSANYTGTALELGGHVPSDAVRETIVAKAGATLPGAAITDNQIIASGEPEDFAAATGFALEQLPRFSNGMVSLSDNNLTVVGVSKDSEAYTAAKAAIAGTLPAGLALASEKIVPSTVSPYSWNADYDGKKVTLGGYVPDDATRSAIVADASAKLPSTSIEDRMQTAAGAPATFPDATGFALAQLPNFSSGSVALNDLKLSVMGIAKDSATFATAKDAIAGKLPAKMALARDDIKPATISPYTWRADFAGSTTTLSGYIPDNDAREGLVNSTKELLGGTVIDEMQIADGEPEGFGEATRFALEQLPRFSEGFVALSDSNLTVEGIAKDGASYEAAKAAVAGSLPAAMSLGGEKIVAPTASPYTWAAKYDGSNTTLTGHVPSSDMRAAIVADATAKLPNSKVVDQMQIAQGEPAGFQQGTAFALAQLSGFSTGNVSLSDSDLTVRGTALDVPAYDAAKAAVAGDMPAGFALKEEKIVPATVSPYQWSADYDGKTVKLNGFVPDNAAREVVLSEAKAKLPGADIVDNMQVAQGAPADFSASTSLAIGLLPRFTDGNVALTDTDLTVKGNAKSEADFTAANNAVKGSLAGGMSLAMADIKPAPAPKDYTWEAERRGNAIILSGFAPSKTDRGAFADRAREVFPGASVVNRIVPRSDAPGGFGVNANKGMDLLTRLKTGKASIVNQTMSIKGQASSVDNYESALADVADDLTDGYNWDVRDIKPAVVSPYTWTLVKGGDKAEQSGFVPSRGFGNSMVAATTATLVKPVTDTQRVAAGEPANFGNAIAAAINAVTTLDKSRATITDTNLLVQGKAGSEALANRLRDEIAASVPANFKVKSDISYPEPKPEPKPEPVVKAEPKPEPKPAPKPAPKKIAKVEPKPAPPPKIACEVKIRKMVSNEKIQFATDRALIRAGSNGLLNRIANEAKTCPNAKFEVWGHTDARGRQQYNQQLSEARARSVVSFLASAGVKRENLKPVGYGELRPLETNETVSGRAANRRIEFVVVSN